MKKFNIVVLLVGIGMLLLFINNPSKTFAIKASSESGNNKEIILNLKVNPSKSHKEEIPLKDLNFKLVSNKGKVEKVKQLNLFEEPGVSGDKAFKLNEYKYPNTKLDLNYSFSNFNVAKKLETNRSYLWQAKDIKIGNLTPNTKYLLKLE